MAYLGNTPTSQSFIAGTDYFSGNGTTTSFTLSRMVASVNDIEVLVNNVAQIPNSYSALGTTLTLSAAPSTGTQNIYVRYLSTTTVNTILPNGTSTTFDTITYTGGLIGGTGIVNIGNGQIYKDTSGNVGIGNSSPSAIGSYPTIDIRGASGGGLRLGSTANPSYIYTDAAGMTIGTANAQPVIFFTSGVERGRFDNAGQFSIGKVQASESASTGTGFGFSSPMVDPWFSVVNTNASGQNACIYLNKRNTGGLVTFMTNNGSTSTAVGNISHNGSATAYNTSSDYRLKEGISPILNATSKVLLLKPVTYTWKATSILSEGFIAHELAEVIPLAVFGTKDAVDAEGKPIYQGIDTSFLVATLTAAIQEQQALIESLTTRLTALEAK